MKYRLSSIEKMLTLSIAFTMLLLAARTLFTEDLFYIFYVWNTFLAIIPFLFSRQLIKKGQINTNSVLLIAGWLVFFPNAPYIITDIFHYSERPPVPKWYDLLLIVSGTWNGLVLGIVSLLQVEQFLYQHVKTIWVRLSVFASFILCGYGIYIGRFLRFNSWDILTNPHILVFNLVHEFLHPQHHLRTWGFTFLFAVMFSIIYFTVKQLPRLFERGQYLY